MMSSIGLCIVLAFPAVFSLPFCNWGCPKIYQPVCASNGKTYGNLCVLCRVICKDNSIKFKHSGRCHEVEPNCEHRVCPTLYDPVCGTDGKTYSNSCVLGLARCRNPGLRMAHRGRCDGSGIEI